MHQRSFVEQASETEAIFALQSRTRPVSLSVEDVHQASLGTSIDICSVNQLYDFSNFRPKKINPQDKELGDLEFIETLP